MRHFLFLIIFMIVLTLINASIPADVISFNVDVRAGYEGYFDESTRTVELKTPIKATITKQGISGSGKICGYHLWSNKKEGKTLPFIVHRVHDEAVLKPKSGANFSNPLKRVFKFSIQAFDCDPIKHVSVKVPVRLHVIPNERPIWSKKAYSFTVAEGKPAGTQVGKIHASEHGTSISNLMCNYEVVRPEDAPFDVDGKGAIYTRKELHVNDVSNYILRVRADDCWKPKARSSLVSVNIRIAPVCTPGWHGVHSQLNYRVGSGQQVMFTESELRLVVACSSDRPAALATRRIRVHLRLEPGDRSACPISSGCPLTAGERLGAPPPPAGKAKAGPHEVHFNARTVEGAERKMAAALVYANTDLEPTPSKRLVRIETFILLSGARSSSVSDEEHVVPVQSVVVVLLPRLVPLLHPNIAGAHASSSVTVPDSVLTGPGYPVLHDLHMLLAVDRAAGKQEPAVDLCVLRIHPKLTPVAYLEWPKEAVLRANLKALNTSTQFNLKGVAAAGVYRNILRQVRYHHHYPYALNSTSFVLVCLEHNSPNQDTGDSSMLVLKLRIHHESGPKPAAGPAAQQQPPREVAESLHDPPPAIMHEKPLPSFEEERPAPMARAQSALRHHEDSAPTMSLGAGGGTWSAGAVVGFVLGLVFLALASYLAVMRYRRYRAVTASGAGLPPGVGGPGGEPGPDGRFGIPGLRADSAERQSGGHGGGLEMEWDNSELNITVNPMEESFTKYSQVVHYREFSSDEDGEDDEDISSLLSGIPEEGEEESARSCGSGSYGGVTVGLGGAVCGADEQDWQWEDDMLPAYTHRPSPLGPANSHV